MDNAPMVARRPTAGATVVDPVPAATVAAVTVPAPRPNHPAPSIDKARAALNTARRQRAEYLVAITDGLVTVLDVIEAAAADSGRALRRISLRQLLLSQPGWGERRTNRILSALAARMGANDDPKDMTIAWLIDPRSGGRRFLAWLDVLGVISGEPRKAFPYTGPKQIGGEWAWQ